MSAVSHTVVEISRWRTCRTVTVRGAAPFNPRLTYSTHLLPNSSHTSTANSAGLPATAALRPDPSTTQRLAAGQAGSTRRG